MPGFRVELDRASSVPLYRQLSDQLLAGIEAGQIAPGDAIEPELDLARELRLSRPTVRRAIARLVDRGLLVRRRGIGTVVASPWVQGHGQLNSIYDDLIADQRVPRTEVLALEHGVVNARAAEALHLPPRTPLIHLTRLRRIGSMPFAILDNYLPPETPIRDALDPATLASSGLYQLLREHGSAPMTATQRFGARNATTRERKILGLTRADPLLTMSRTAFAADGSPIECGDHCYRGDQYAVDVRVSVADEGHGPGESRR